MSSPRNDREKEITMHSVASSDARPLHAWHINAATLAEVSAGDLVVLDPIYGAERVVERFEHSLSDLAVGASVSFWEVLRLHLVRHSAEDGTAFSRYVVRFPHEPCVVIESDERMDAMGQNRREGER